MFATEFSARSFLQGDDVSMSTAFLKPKAAGVVEELILIPVALGILATLGTVLISAIVLKLAVTVVVVPALVCGVVALATAAAVVGIAFGVIAALGATVFAATSLAGFVATALAGGAFAGICLVVAPIIGLAGAVLGSVIRAGTRQDSDDSNEHWQGLQRSEHDTCEEENHFKPLKKALFVIVLTSVIFSLTNWTSENCYTMLGWK